MLEKSKGYSMATTERRVHPKPVRSHGFIGLPFVKKHMFLDNQWSGGDLMQQYKSMTNFLAKHHHLKRIEIEHLNRNIARKYRNLRKQCHDGRHELQAIRGTHNRRIIRNLLEDHKEQQCLYQNLPVNQVLENIDQKTFLMRKERDRLCDRKTKLKKELKALKIKHAALEDRIKFHNLFELDEEKLAKDCEKKLTNTNVRLKGIATINMTYKKILQTLRHDEIFYEPILQSLNDDINDQSRFIEHILDLGKPALQKFQKLKDSFKKYDDNAHRDSRNFIRGIASKSKLLSKNSNPASRYKEGDRSFMEEARERYMRTTGSMCELESRLQDVSETIKTLKFATLCSASTEVFPRIKGQIDHNYKLKKEIVCDSLSHSTLETKEKFCDVLQGVIKNNVSQVEIDRLDRITELNEFIAFEDKIELQNIEALKTNNDLFVILRVFLWNIYDMLRNVDKSPQFKKVNYPNSYLKLPLLKFEMMTMFACAPDPLDDDMHELYSTIHHKMTQLMAAYNRLMGDHKNHQVKLNRENYMDDIISLREYETVQSDMDISKRPTDTGDDDTDMDYDTKENNRPSLPYNRAQLKERSLHLVEEQLKKE